MQNYLIIRAGQNFRLGSGVSVEDEAAMFSALCDLLTRNGLTRTPLSPPHGGDWEGFELREMDLTEDGLAVIDCGLDRWLKALDRGKLPSDISIFDKCFAKLTKNAQ
jgi:hypothetical protein